MIPTISGLTSTTFVSPLKAIFLISDALVRLVISVKESTSSKSPNRMLSIVKIGELPKITLLSGIMYNANAVYKQKSA